MLKPYYIEHILEAGCDEAGRGPLAGSVFAAAVILPMDIDKLACEGLVERLNDSKQLSAKQRYELRPLIEKYALAFAVAQVTPEEIDQINILNASILGMHRALAQLNIVPAHILVDGNKWRPYVPQNECLEIPAQTIVKGDGKYLSIAAASILAKTYRDDYMLELHEMYPNYHWNKNMGYPTKEHYQAIQQFGITPYHRKTFKLLKNNGNHCEK